VRPIASHALQSKSFTIKKNGRRLWKSSYSSNFEQRIWVGCKKECEIGTYCTEAVQKWERAPLGVLHGGANKARSRAPSYVGFGPAGAFLFFANKFRLPDQPLTSSDNFCGSLYGCLIRQSIPNAHCPLLLDGNEKAPP
jgi:hypothetical protein